MRKFLPLFIVAGVGLLALLLFMAPWQAWRHDYAALGDKGLELWLQSHDIAVRRAKHRETALRADLSLRIMPFPYFRNDYKSRYNKIPQMDTDRFIDKIYELPSLTIMSKWQEHVSDKGRATSGSLLSLGILNDNMEYVFDELELVRPQDDFAQEKVKIAAPFTAAMFSGFAGEAVLYQPQFFDRDTIPEFCKEVLGLRQGALLISCNDEQPLYFLSDPDLLNNHGLALGDNAALAVAMVRMIRGADETRPVYLDNNTELLRDAPPEEDERKDYERSGTDWARFLDYPLSVIWGLMLLTMMVSLWRGFYRFGPPWHHDHASIELSKTAAVTATARLLRLSRNDAPIIAQFVHGLLLDKAARLFGPQAVGEAGIERLLARFERRDRVQGQECRRLIALLTTQAGTLSERELHGQLKLLQHLLKEF